MDILGVEIEISLHHGYLRRRDTEPNKFKKYGGASRCIFFIKEKPGTSSKNLGNCWKNGKMEKLKKLEKWKQKWKMEKWKKMENLMVP